MIQCHRDGCVSCNVAACVFTELFPLLCHWKALLSTAELLTGMKMSCLTEPQSVRGGSLEGAKAKCGASFINNDETTPAITCDALEWMFSGWNHRIWTPKKMNIYVWYCSFGVHEVISGDTFHILKMMVPNLGVGTPLRGHKINLEGPETIKRVRKEKHIKATQKKLSESLPMYYSAPYLLSHFIQMIKFWLKFIRYTAPSRIPTVE